VTKHLPPSGDPTDGSANIGANEGPDRNETRLQSRRSRPTPCECCLCPHRRVPGQDGGRCGRNGTKITVTLTGLTSDETVSVRWYNSKSTAYQTIKSNANASATGQMTITFVVPSSQPSGKDRVEAVGNSSSKVETLFTISS
jgi:hypothetical protein